MSSKKILSLSEVNALESEQFQLFFGNVVEHCPEAAYGIAYTGPFTSVNALKKSFQDYLDKLNNHEKEGVLIKHPDLAGKFAEIGCLTMESQHEQQNAGLESMAIEEKQMLTNYNGLYKRKFRFPFVICASENNVQTILTAIQARLQNTRENELHTGIEEVKKICNMRIDNLVQPDV